MTANMTPRAAMTNAPIAIANLHDLDTHAPIYDPDIETAPHGGPTLTGEILRLPLSRIALVPTIRWQVTGVNHPSTARHPRFAVHTSAPQPGGLDSPGPEFEVRSCCNASPSSRCSSWSTAAEKPPSRAIPRRMT